MRLVSTDLSILLCTPGPYGYCYYPCIYKVQGRQGVQGRFPPGLEVDPRLDLVEEFLAANIWPLSDGWSPLEIVPKDVLWSTSPLLYPCFGVELPVDANPGLFVEDVERHAVDIIGPSTETELMLARKIIAHELRVNRVFEELGVDVKPHPKPRKTLKWAREAGATGSE